MDIKIITVFQLMYKYLSNIQTCIALKLHEYSISMWLSQYLGTKSSGTTWMPSDCVMT